LQTGSIEPAVLLDCRNIASAYDQAFYVPATPTDSAAQTALALPRGNWRANRDYRKQSIDVLRDRFSYILIDCPSLNESRDIVGLATIVDGVVLVVEANKTSKGQLANLERTVSDAGGNVVGSLLNKRTYPIPGCFF
jgi:cellulose biosynthesis protein BcsQ